MTERIKNSESQQGVRGLVEVAELLRDKKKIN